MQNGSTTEKAIVIMQLDTYCIFFGEDGFLSTARMFGAKGLLKSVATAATNKYIIFHAKPQMFAIQVFHWQHWFHWLYHGKHVTRNFKTPAYCNLQPAAVMPTAQKANINVISGGWEKRGIKWLAVNEKWLPCTVCQQTHKTLLLLNRKRCRWKGTDVML